MIQSPACRHFNDLYLSGTAYPKLSTIQARHLHTPCMALPFPTCLSFHCHPIDAAQLSASGAYPRPPR